MFRAKELRNAKGKSMRQVAIELNIPYTTYVSYEKEDREPNSEMLTKLSDYFGCSIDYLIGRTDIRARQPSNLVPMSEFHKGSLVGDIACGVPLNQEESEEVLLPFGADLALYCRGDSMINIGIGDGDIVYIRRLDGFDELINGRIAAVGIGDDYEYTLKRWFYNETTRTLKLVPENDNYKTLTFRGEELADIHLLGVAVGYTSVL
jgi:repressor LexA